MGNLALEFSLFIAGILRVKLLLGFPHLLEPKMVMFGSVHHHVKGWGGEGSISVIHF